MTANDTLAMYPAKITKLFAPSDCVFKDADIVKIANFIQRCSNWRISIRHAFEIPFQIVWYKEIVVITLEGFPRSYSEWVNATDMLRVPPETLTVPVYFPSVPLAAPKSKLNLPQYLWVIIPLILEIKNSYFVDFFKNHGFSSLKHRLLIEESLTHPMSARRDVVCKIDPLRSTHVIHHFPPTEREMAQELIIESAGLTKKIKIHVNGVLNGAPTIDGSGQQDFDCFADAKKVFPSLEVKGGRNFTVPSFHGGKDGIRWLTYESAKAKNFK